MDDVIEIYDSDSNECTVTGSNIPGIKRKYEHSSDSDSYSSYSSSSGSERNRTANAGPILVEDSSSESEYEGDEWDKDCKVVEVITTPNNLHGFLLMPTCPNDPELQPFKKEECESPELRKTLKDDVFESKFQCSWKSKSCFNVNDVELITNPFDVCVIQNVLEDPSFLSRIRDEFNEVEWNKRNLDLYEFFQSKDLQHIDNLKSIRKAYDFLKNDIMPWVAKLTGFELTHISATCSLYSDTDYLLVHDDRQDDRMVAYVLYLTGKEEWKSEYGGALQLFSKDSDGHPLVPVKDILPQNNQFVFFPVTNESYHQVAEVTHKNDSRMSINGWFHTRNPPDYDIPIYNPPLNGLYGSTTITQENVDIDLEAWIESIYLNPGTIQDVQGLIEQDSEISLGRYFKKEPLKEVLDALQYEGIKWNKVGPPNRRLYEVISEDNIPHALERFLKLFRSQQMFSLLSKYTDLELRGDKASLRYEFQRWTPGCYSLLTDYDWYQRKELDVIMYFGCSRDSMVVGGRTQYINTDEQIQNALITLEPQENNLNLVYRDTARITKYVSKQSSCKCFYILVCSYSE